MNADRDQTRILPLLLTACFVLLTTVQLVRPYRAPTDDVAGLAGPSNSLRTHTREEVGAKAIDLSSSARHGSRLPLRELERQARMPEFADDAEVDVPPMRQLIHRRVAPSSPDDGFPSALR